MYPLKPIHTHYNKQLGTCVADLDPTEYTQDRFELAPDLEGTQRLEPHDVLRAGMPAHRLTSLLVGGHVMKCDGRSSNERWLAIEKQFQN